MKIYCLLFVAAYFSTVNLSFSQIGNLRYDIDILSQNGNLSYDAGDKTIQGSPYIQENFTPAKVTADVEKKFNARYNAVTDQIEIETEKSTIQGINKHIPGITVTFLNNNKVYKGMTYFDEKGNTVTGYLVPITNTDLNVKLYIKETIRFIDRKPAKTSYDTSKPAKFEKVDDTYYIAIENQIAKPLSSNKKEIAALFPDKEKEILKHISSEKLNVKKQGDLIKLINHLNQVK